MPIQVYHMSSHRVVGKAVKSTNDRSGRYWSHYCYFMQTEYVFSPDYIYIYIFSHNTELLFVREDIFGFGCCRDLRGKIPRQHFTFKKCINQRASLPWWHSG